MDRTRPTRELDFDYDSDENEGGELIPGVEDQSEHTAVSSEYADSEPALVDEIDASEHESVGERDDVDESQLLADEEAQAIDGDATPAKQPTTGDDAPPATKKRKRDDATTGLPPRKLGKSVFPVSRIQKILKADTELPMVSKEAVLLISLATEEFIGRLCLASEMYARKEGRATVQRRDTALAVRRADEFWFLEEIIPFTDPSPHTQRKPGKSKANEKKSSSTDGAKTNKTTTTLDQFVQRTRVGERDDEEEEEEGGGDVIMNEDGTMSFVQSVPVDMTGDGEGS